MSLHQYAETHDVFNQVPSLDGANLYRLDRPLQEWVQRFGAGWAADKLDAYGALAGGPLMAAGFLANENKPVFKSHDRYGNRADLVEFHPAYHQLMATAIEHGLHSLPWDRSACRCPCCPRWPDLSAQSGRSRQWLSADHDVRIGAGPQTAT